MQILAGFRDLRLDRLIRYYDLTQPGNLVRSIVGSQDLRDRTIAQRSLEL